VKIKFQSFETAYKELSNLITPSPLIKNSWLSDFFHCNIYLKLENLLPVGSFKIRGASYKILNLSAEQAKNGILAVSAGNHAQGVAWGAKKFDVKAKIIMPIGSALTKITNTQALGAEVIIHGEDVEAGFEYAQKMLEKTKLTFIHPFEDPYIIAGQGTVAFEILNQLPQVDFLFGSIGGGGLMCGIGTVMKQKAPKTIIVGAQATGSSSMVQSLQKGELTSTDKAETFADGIKVRTPSQVMFDLLDKVVDEAVHVSDDQIALSVLSLMEQARIITEGAGALPLAAFDQLHRINPKRFIDKNVVLVIGGGNIDINVVDRIIDRGLVTSKRKATISVLLPDKPGALKELTEVLYESNANILQAIHNRDAPNLELQQSKVKVTIEVKGEEHLTETVAMIAEKFPHVSLEQEKSIL